MLHNNNIDVPVGIGQLTMLVFEWLFGQLERYMCSMAYKFGKAYTFLKTSPFRNINLCILMHVNFGLIK